MKYLIVFLSLILILSSCQDLILDKFVTVESDETYTVLLDCENGGLKNHTGRITIPKTFLLIGVVENSECNFWFEEGQTRYTTFFRINGNKNQIVTANTPYATYELQ